MSLNPIENLTYLPSSLRSSLSNGVKLLIDNAPKHALIPFSKLPASFQEKTLNWAFNQLFKTQLADDELSFLQDKWLEIIISDVGYRCFITVEPTNSEQQQLCRIVLNCPQEANTRFEADSNSLLKLFCQSVDPDTLFFQRKLLITGDTELGLEIKNFLDDLDRESLPQAVKFLLEQHTKFSHKYNGDTL